MWENRLNLENLLKEKKNVVSFISCTTAVESKDKDVYPGVAFWINFDWPGYALYQVESLFCKLFLEAGIQISSCKTLVGRGEIFYFENTLWIIFSLLLKYKMANIIDL